MNTRDLLECAACAGVEFRLDAVGTGVVVGGPAAARGQWLPALRASKSEVVAELQRRTRPTPAQEAELRELTAAIYANAEEAQLGFALGLIDINAALTCYRSLAAHARNKEFLP